jgi:GntR family transcriptional repressor for pyruvate dehydrogenase complex
MQGRGQVLEESAAPGPIAPSEASLEVRLRGAVDAEEVVAGGRLLPERELAERLSVGRRAIRRALSQLEGEGIIWRRQGKGTGME